MKHQIKHLFSLTVVTNFLKSYTHTIKVTKEAIFYRDTVYNKLVEMVLSGTNESSRAAVTIKQMKK